MTWVSRQNANIDRPFQGDISAHLAIAPENGKQPRGGPYMTLCAWCQRRVWPAGN